MRYQTDQGFSFVELMLAAMLSGILLVSVYGVFAQGLRVERFLQSKENVARDGYWISQIITRDLENMVPFSSPGSPGPFFIGKPDEISVIITDEQYGLRRVRYRLMPPEETVVHTVVVNREPVEFGTVMNPGGNNKQRRQRTLTRDIMRFPHTGQEGSVEAQQVMSFSAAEDGLRFYYQDAAPESSWEDQWEKEAWPGRVRIDVTLLDGQNQEHRLVKDILVIQHQF